MEKLPRQRGVVEYQHKSDSIEVTKNTKGEYSWKIKIYYDADSGTATRTHEKVTKLIKIIDGDLRKKFK